MAALRGEPDLRKLLRDRVQAAEALVIVKERLSDAKEELSLKKSIAKEAIRPTAQ